MEYPRSARSMTAISIFMIIVTCMAANIAGMEYLGHDLIPRSQYLAASGRSMVDTGVPLAEGFLQQFLLYVHPLPDDSSVPTVELQVWTLTDDPKVYVLKWQMVANFTEGSGKLYQFPVPMGEHVYITPSDRLGLTWSEGINPVTYDFVQDSPVYLRRIQEGTPVPGDSFQFDPISYPAVFSIGIRVAEDLPSSDGASVYIGNGLIPRASYIADADSVRRAWIDQTLVPRDGNLISYHVFVGQFGEGNPRIRLQIWTPKPDMEGKAFTLKWDKLVRLSEGENRIYKFDIPHSESIHVTSSDKLGWTFVDDIAPIPGGFSLKHQSYMLELTDGLFPSLGNTCQFDGLPMPVEFSVGITLDIASPPIETEVEPEAEGVEIVDRLDTSLLESVNENRFSFSNAPCSVPKSWTIILILMVPWFLTNL